MSLIPQITYPAIVIPRWRKDLLSRPRLLEQLYNLLERKLILVVVPVGYGKTSLLVDFAHQKDIDICWLSLDRYTWDLRRFLAHFIAAIARCCPQAVASAQAMLEDGSQTEIYLDQFIPRLVNEMHTHISEHFLVVLDDFHRVDNVPEIMDFTRRFIEAVDDHCHLALLSRRQPDIPGMAQFIGRGQVGGLGMAELAFQPGEIQALLWQNEHIQLPDAKAQELAQRSQGWIAALQFSTFLGEPELSRATRLEHLTGVDLHDYLSSEVFEGLPEALQIFLLRSSMLEQFNAGLCQAVLHPTVYPQNTDWAELIDEVQRRNLFVQIVNGQGVWLSYHPLFRDFLQARLKREHPAEAIAILRRLAEVSTAQEEWEEAHDAYQRLGDLEGLANLLEACGSPLVRSGRIALLRSWLDELPLALLSSRPYLLAHKGITLAMAEALPEAINLYTQAIEALSTGGNPQHLARALARRSNAYHMQGKYALSLQDAETLNALTEHDPVLRSEYAEGLSLMGVSLRQMGDAAGSIQKLSQALAIYQELGDEYSAANTLHTLGLSHRFLGDFHAARNAYQQALEHARKTRNLVRCADLLNNLAVLHNLLGEYEQAAGLIQEGMQIARQSGYLRAEGFLFCTLGALHFALDDFEAARQAFSLARQIAIQTDSVQLLGYLDREAAELAWQAGDFAQARRMLQSASAHAEESGSQFEQAQCRRTWGLLAQAEGDMESAQHDLQEALDMFTAGGWMVEAAQVGLRLAAVCQSNGNVHKARQELADAFERTRPEALAILVEPGRDTRALLQQAGDQAQVLLQRVDQFEQELPAVRRRLRQMELAVPPSPPDLVIQAFGGSRVSLRGRVIGNADWQSGAARELLFYLLSSPGWIHHQAIGAALWSEFSPQRLSGHFRITLHRLRMVFGESIVVQQDRQFAFNHALDYEYDVARFDSLLAHARSTADTEARAESYRQAVLIYKGSFLPDIAHDWAEIERERLRQAHLEAVQFMAEHHLQRKEYAVSLEYCQRVLAQEPWQESICRIAMRALAALGDRGTVMRLYQQCRQACQQVYGQSPSTETDNLYQTLTR